MQVVALLSRSPRCSPVLSSALCAFVLLYASTALAATARPGDSLPLTDPSMLASLQLRVQQASPREQVQLYADLLDKISLLASREIADGDAEKAQATLHQLEVCSAEIETALHRDSKGLKRTEMLLHTTRRRLTDMVRSASGDMKPMVQNAVAKLDRAQAALLSAVFEH